MEDLSSAGKAGCDIAANIAETIPLVSVIAIIFREIIVLAEKAGHNKRVCRRLAERVRVANQTLNQLTLKDENDLALKNYVQAITHCKEFIEKISHSGAFMKLVTAHEIESAYQNATEELDAAIIQLGLNVCIRTNKDIEDDRKLFLSEIKTSFQAIEEVTKDLYDVGMDIQQKLSVFEAKLDTIHTAVDNVSKGVIVNNQTLEKSLEQSKIPSNQITDYDEEEVKRGHVMKKKYIMQAVAQKEIGHIYSLQKSIDIIEREISNFSSSRKESDVTTKVKDITLRYSFAIVLWELAAQEVPFANVTVVTDLITKITSGERPPPINDAPPFFPAYEKIMQQGWQQRPIKRPTADLMFKDLNNLYKSIRSQSGSGDFEPPSSSFLRSDSFDSHQNGNSQKDFNNIEEGIRQIELK
ncbi:12567_t:CDS:2 [Racocetra fulgida]|uniref:12567_t:CDS:1 n=1 Tax=Racocetra fulgida TaxID=60492 RepID=A0A9N9GK26_9GLOM|nr:12567_t:CDS:2 [Racocetra fulgida]